MRPHNSTSEDNRNDNSSSSRINYNVNDSSDPSVYNADVEEENDSEVESIASEGSIKSDAGIQDNDFTQVSSLVLFCNKNWYHISQN